MNIDDHEGVLLRALPPRCTRALDVGCGHAQFARALTTRVLHVDAIDRVDLGVPAAARLRFVHADFMAHAFEPESYDFISAIASLHHLPFADALAKMRSLLRPGGVLGVIGLFRDATLLDFGWSAVAWPIAQWRRLGSRPAAPVPPPLQPPTMTLAEIREGAERILPGVRFDRRLLWRYILLWKKPTTRANALRWRAR